MMKDYFVEKLGIETNTAPATLHSVPNSQKFKLLEYKAFYNGEEEDIALFYNSGAVGSAYPSGLALNNKLFWNNIGYTHALVHSGLPRNISHTMARLLFHNGIVIEGETPQLREILDDNSFHKLLEEAATTESWGGEFALKISYDPEITQYPILELVSPLNFEPIKKRGRLVEIRFFEELDVRGNHYKFFEIYGKGYIKYELYRLGSKNKYFKVDVKEVFPDLEDFEFSEPIILAGYKQNLNGVSDYHGIISEIHALDEILSGMLSDVKVGLAKTFIPESRIVEGGRFNVYQNEYITIRSDLTEGANNNIVFDQPEIRTEQYNSAANNILNYILSNVGLNKTTLGFEVQIGQRLSAESRRLMEANSLRTRESKVEGWTEFLNQFLPIIIKADGIFAGRAASTTQLRVVFNEYMIDSEDATEENIELVKAGVITPEEAKEKLGV